jgi:predicted dehydrogenase
MIKLGAVGVDSSHLPEFTGRIKKRQEAGESPCRVVASWTDGKHDMPEDQVADWQAKAKEMGVEPAESMDALLGAVDGVLVLAVNGHRHLDLALPALQRGMPVYIDKPLTCNLEEARQIAAAVEHAGARCYSASSLRFTQEVASLDREALGDVVAVDAFGPGELNPSMAGLFFYGVHTIELVDAILGPGVSEVQAWTTTARDLVKLHYRDGRLATLRLERQGTYEFGATVHGTKGVSQFMVNFGPLYDGMVRAITDFFEGRPAPVELERTLENIAVMEAGNRSMQASGQVQSVEAVALA